jgi:hypothetical protein
VEATHDKRVKDHVHTVPTSFISAIFLTEHLDVAMVRNLEVMLDKL